MTADLPTKAPLPYVQNINELGNRYYSGAAKASPYPLENVFQENFTAIFLGHLVKTDAVHKVVQGTMDIQDSLAIFEIERTNRFRIELSERINKITNQNQLLHKLLRIRSQDQSLGKIVNVLSKYSPQNYNVEATDDNSVYFSLFFSDKTTLFLEFFLEKSDAEPDFVFLVYSEGNCIANGKGDVDNISKKMSLVFKGR